jgi:ATP-dependent DNA helicase RecG
MYSLTTPVEAVKGIGPKLSIILREYRLNTVKDLLLFLPLRYEDRSEKKTIAQLIPGELVTVEAEITATSNFYKGRRSIQTASVKDETGRLKLMWFNNPHVLARFARGTKILISGKLNDRGTMIQPTTEMASSEAIHTGRLVPIYSHIPEFPPATLRRTLKHIIDHLNDLSDPLEKQVSKYHLTPLREALCILHFPDEEEQTIEARERLALEELLTVIHHSQQLRTEWNNLGNAVPFHTQPTEISAFTQHFPFQLTGAQLRCTQEIFADIQTSVPMNRLLIGDVGSGKTAVAGMACARVIQDGSSAVLVAPTQILVEQHLHTLTKLFPDLPIQVVTAKTKKTELRFDQPSLFVGTHAVLNALQLIKPALLIYDEQHRFGVMQRSRSQELEQQPHVLTLSATPIPRTFMLTLFSHLSLSVIDEMPAGRKPVTTWVVPESKRASSYTWIADQIRVNHSQAILVCPFIDPSESEGLGHIASAKERFTQLQKIFAEDINAGTNASTQLRIELLHGRMKKSEQQEITQRLFAKEIDLLVTTPIVEVGIDLPTASVIVIEAAERFGLASLHQLRGRVGRAGQEAFCLLFTSASGSGKKNSSSTDANKRLKQFCDIHDGLKLAEMDLQRRGAGNLFGTEQHGFDQLQFANWTNFELVTKAKLISEEIAADENAHLDKFANQSNKQKWTPFVEIKVVNNEEIPLAN